MKFILKILFKQNIYIYNTRNNITFILIVISCNLYFSLSFLSPLCIFCMHFTGSSILNPVLDNFTLMSLYNLCNLFMILFQIKDIMRCTLVNISMLILILQMLLLTCNNTRAHIFILCYVPQICSKEKNPVLICIMIALKLCPLTSSSETK